MRISTKKYEQIMNAIAPLYVDNKPFTWGDVVDAVKNDNIKITNWLRARGVQSDVNDELGYARDIINIHGAETYKFMG